MSETYDGLCDRNGNGVSDWIRWHEAQGHETSDETVRMIVELITAGYTLSA